MKRPLILYHGNCPDGFCAAWIAHKRFGSEADYVPVNHGEPPLDVTERMVYILDFSYKRDVTLNMARQAKSLYILDHHRTAKKELENLSENTNIYCRFDMEKSGGRLALEYFFPGSIAPWLVAYTESRDLWAFHLPFSKEINAAIASYPKDFAVWDSLEKALSDDPTDLRKLRGKVPESAADFTRRKAEKVLLA